MCAISRPKMHDYLREMNAKVLSVRARDVRTFADEITHATLCQ